MAAVFTIQGGIWLRELNKEVFNTNKKIKIYVDNKGAIATLKNNQYKPRTKHLDIKMKFVKEKIDTGLIEIEYKSTKEMNSDILTKPVTKNSLNLQLPTMGINNPILHP